LPHFLGGGQSERSAKNARLVDSSLHFSGRLNRVNNARFWASVAWARGGKDGICSAAVLLSLFHLRSGNFQHHITHADLRPIGVRIGGPLAGVAAWATIADWLLLWRDLAEWKRMVDDGKLGRATRKPSRALRALFCLRVDQ
jgi:hypothetical protein